MKWDEAGKIFSGMIGLALLFGAVVGLMSEGLLQLGGVLPKSEAPLGIWALIALAAVWCGVACLIFRLIEVVRS